MILLRSWPLTVPQLIATVGLSVAFGFLAWGVRAVTAAAAATGVLLSVVVCVAAGPSALLPITVVFFLTVLSTRTGRRKKERLGTAEGRRGRRATQILANVGVAGICAAPVIFTTHGRYILLAGVSAALAEAAGDTVSSELGQAFGTRPLLITNLREVAPGENGGITIVGTMFALVSAALVSIACIWANLLLPIYFWTALSAAFFGTLLDSVLGATLERPGRLGNNSVNFTSTAFSAALTIGVLFAHRWL